MSDYYFKNNNLSLKDYYRISAIDTEWSKNWKAKDVFVPFCSCIHSIYIGNLTIPHNLDDLIMTSEHCFKYSDESTKNYVKRVDEMVGTYLTKNTIIVGHQISSDLSTLLHCSNKSLKNISALLAALRMRRNDAGHSVYQVADTRYDIRNRKTGNGSEKLRNVSLRLGIAAIQFELDKCSLTKLYALYLRNNDEQLRQQLLVLNWRHAFQTALVWLVDSLGSKKAHVKNDKNLIYLTNDIIYKMGKHKLDYLNSADYLYSRGIEGIMKYITRYEKETQIHPAIIKYLNQNYPLKKIL